MKFGAMASALLVLAHAFLVGQTVAGNPRQESNAIAKLRMLGQVQVDEQRSGHPVVAVSLSGQAVTDAVMNDLAGLA
jgi:hypothetical protein